jgi:hypothetical protein
MGSKSAFHARGLVEFLVVLRVIVIRSIAFDSRFRGQAYDNDRNSKRGNPVSYDESKHPRDENGQFGDGSGFDGRSGTLGGAYLTSTQRYLNGNVVTSKAKGKDFETAVSPEFEINGEKYRAVLDGHHSIAAALITKNTPKFVEHSTADNDAIAHLDNGDTETFLASIHDGEGDFHNPVTGRDTKF